MPINVFCQKQRPATPGNLVLYNCKYFMDTFARLIEEDRNPGFILLDIDHFKSYNDSFGHLEGDIVLRKTGELLRRIMRGTDVCGRCGGEEFGVLIPCCEDLAAVAEKIRCAIEGELKPPAVNIPKTA